MTLRAVVVAAASALALLAPPAGAVPSADRFAGVEAHLSFFGRDKASYLVDLAARVSEVGTATGTGTVEVSIRRCGSFRCTKPVIYRAAVSSSQLSVATDLSSGSLALSLFGRPLALQWFAPQNQTLVAYDTDPRVSLRLYRITMVQGVVAGMKCLSKEALVLQEQVVDPAPAAAAPAALPRTAPRAFAGMLGGTCQSVL